MLAYLLLAAEIDLPLAAMDDGDKAFNLKQQGTILGVDLEARHKRWKLPAEKAHRHRRVFQEIAKASSISCTVAERAMGMALHTTGMLQALGPLTASLLAAVQTAKREGRVTVSPTLRKAAASWLKILYDLLDWQPLCLPIGRPPIFSRTVIIWTHRDSEGFPLSATLDSIHPTTFRWPAHVCSIFY